MIDFEEDEYGNWHLQTDLPLFGCIVIHANNLEPKEKEINPLGEDNASRTIPLPYNR